MIPDIQHDKVSTVPEISQQRVAIYYSTSYLSLWRNAFELKVSAFSLKWKWDLQRYRGVFMDSNIWWYCYMNFLSIGQEVLCCLCMILLHVLQSVCKITGLYFSDFRQMECVNKNDVLVCLLEEWRPDKGAANVSWRWLTSMLLLYRTKSLIQDWCLIPACERVKSGSPWRGPFYCQEWVISGTKMVLSCAIPAVFDVFLLSTCYTTDIVWNKYDSCVHFFCVNCDFYIANKCYIYYQSFSIKMLLW